MKYLLFFTVIIGLFYICVYGLKRLYVYFVDSYRARVLRAALDKKSLFQYRILEEFNPIDFRYIKNKPKKYGTLKELYKNKENVFYSFCPNLNRGVSNHYILKTNLAETKAYFFGEKNDITFFYKNYMVQVPGSLSCITFTSIDRGERKVLFCFRPIQSTSPHAHYVKHDSLVSVFGLQGNQNCLLFFVSRYNGNFHNKDENYKAIPEYALLVFEKHGDFKIVNSLQSPNLASEYIRKLFLSNRPFYQESFGGLTIAPLCDLQKLEKILSDRKTNLLREKQEK